MYDEIPAGLFIKDEVADHRVPSGQTVPEIDILTKLIRPELIVAVSAPVAEL